MSGSVYLPTSTFQYLVPVEKSFSYPGWDSLTFDSSVWHPNWKVLVHDWLLDGGNSNMFGIFTPIYLGKIFTNFEGSHIFQMG